MFYKVPVCVCWFASHNLVTYQSPYIGSTIHWKFLAAAKHWVAGFVGKYEVEGHEELIKTAALCKF